MLSEQEEYIAELRARLSHAEVERDEARVAAMTASVNLGRVRAERDEVQAERDRLLEAVRALADEWDRVRRPQLRACASDLRALLPTSGPSQADAEPQHADGEWRA